DINHHRGAGEPHRQHGKERLPAGQHARGTTFGPQDLQRFGEASCAHIVERTRFHRRAPSTWASQVPNREPGRAAAVSPLARRPKALKNWLITMRAAPSSNRPPTAATLPPTDAS